MRSETRTIRVDDGPFDRDDAARKMAENWVNICKQYAGSQQLRGACNNLKTHTETDYTISPSDPAAPRTHPAAFVMPADRPC